MILKQQDPNAIKYVSILIMNLLQFFTCQWIPQFLLNEVRSLLHDALMLEKNHVNVTCHVINHVTYAWTSQENLYFFAYRV